MFNLLNPASPELILFLCAFTIIYACFCIWAFFRIGEAFTQKADPVQEHKTTSD